MLDLNAVKFLSKKQINNVAPSVFTNHPSSEVTEKYTFITTEKIPTAIAAMVGAFLLLAFQCTQWLLENSAAKLLPYSSGQSCHRPTGPDLVHLHAHALYTVCSH